MRNIKDMVASFFTKTAGSLKRAIARNAAALKQAVTTAGVFCAAGVMAFAVGEFSDSVTIVSADRQLTVYTMQREATSILAQHYVDVGENDEILCDYNESGKISRITVNSAFAVTVTADGRSQTVYMLRGTVADALYRAGVEVGEQDKLSAELDAPLIPGMEISLQRVQQEVIVTTESIPYTTQYVEKTGLYKEINDYVF